MQRLSLNHYITPDGYPLARFLDEAAEAGAEGVGLTERALSETALPELKRALRDRSLAVTSVNSAGFFLWSDADRAAQQSETNSRLIASAAELGADTLVLIGGGLHDLGGEYPGHLAAARARLDDAIPAILEEATRAGVRLGIEPMHPLRIFTKACLNTLAQTEALLQRHPGLGVVLDLFHSWWDPDLHDAIGRIAERITLVQVCGVTQPRTELALPRRCLLGEGVVDLPAILSTLSRAGYRGRFEFELFAPDLDGRAPADVMRAAIRDFERLSREEAEEQPAS
ncbi:sugar phosphate isomerase/epimerase family protein [Enterovirga aerilata]|uniref:Sugar phosphate isomerase/epimerase n=1 Tax=Enterovirga aerilata TaxID=2730920 RepID=A0A849IA48_9HYPH|nr:sugar phosphate isomerase/epimerase [Enterovirga sp. DB1703]NNM74181.1 sugar phosphate isomerase/epimerase [Enterovirga sp. DB1703]